LDDPIDHRQRDLVVPGLDEIVVGGVGGLAPGAHRLDPEAEMRRETSKQEIEAREAIFRDQHLSSGEPGRRN
jgi:hypothetical protein